MNTETQFPPWIPISERSPDPYVAVLTIHEADLYPVAAFVMGNVEEIWMRETEGPEDIPITGRHEQLYRPPTHWMPLPLGPKNSMPMTANTPVQTGRLPRRFLTPDFTTEPVPDSIWVEGKGFVTNPAWEAAPYEETFFDENKKQLPPMSQYEAFREMRKGKKA